MNKIAVSVTLAAENLAWLRARTRKARARSLSETLDRLIEAAGATQTNASPPRSVSAFCEALFSNPAYQPLDLTVEQVRMAHDRTPSNDLFDALICSAATCMELPLITRDAAIVDSKLVRVLW